MFNVVRMALVGSEWVEKIVESFKTREGATAKADSLNGTRDDTDDPAMVAFVVKLSRKHAV